MKKRNTSGFQVAHGGIEETQTEQRLKMEEGLQKRTRSKARRR